MFGALRLLSRALAFRRAACLLARVDNMLEYVRESKFPLLRETFRVNYSKAIRRAAHDRLASLPRGPYKKPRVLRRRAAHVAVVDRRLFSTCHIGLLHVFILLRCSCLVNFLFIVCVPIKRNVGL